MLLYLATGSGDCMSSLATLPVKPRLSDERVTSQMLGFAPPSSA